MALALTPRLQHAGFLRAVVAGIYAAGMQPEDYLVLARRSDLAATRTTELLKSRSEAGENLRIARSKLNSHLQDLQRDDADRRIFLSDKAEPAPRRLFGLFNVPTPELRGYEQRRKILEGALAGSTARHRDAESLVKSRHAQLDRLIKEQNVGSRLKRKRQVQAVSFTSR